MADSDPAATFKVTDRRRLVDEADAAAQPAANAEPISRPEPPRGTPPPPAEAPRHDAEQTSSERALTGLFVMLASSAVMAIGDAPDPTTGEVHRELDQAAGLIDLLLLLREKTEGHRTADETQVLDEVVYDLQLRYVAATRPS